MEARRPRHASADIIKGLHKEGDRRYAMNSGRQVDPDLTQPQNVLLQPAFFGEAISCYSSGNTVDRCIEDSLPQQLLRKTDVTPKTRLTFYLEKRDKNPVRTYGMVGIDF